MGYKLKYKSSVEKDLRRLDKKDVLLILQKLENQMDKLEKTSKRLKGDFVGLLSYRVGNFRVIYTILENTILILRVGHRKNVRPLQKRIEKELLEDLEGKLQLAS